MKEHNSPSISIIVAIYNASLYLEKCLQSILRQTFSEFEVILINDGSTDSSQQICEQFVSKDSRFQLYNQSNRGVGHVRKLGVELARGEYSIHIDPDDWVEPNMLKEMHDAAKSMDSDVLISSFIVDSPQGTKINRQFKMNHEDNFNLLKCVLNGTLHGALWNKLIKHKLYNDLNIRFYDINFCEDQLVFDQLLIKGAKVKFLDKAYYHYVQHDKSITNVIGSDFIESKLMPYHRALYEIVHQVDLKLYNTSLFFFYNYLKNNSVEEKILSYLKPKSIFALASCYLDIQQKQSVLNHLQASRWQYYFLRILNKFTNYNY